MLERIWKRFQKVGSLELAVGSFEHQSEPKGCCSRRERSRIENALDQLLLANSLSGSGLDRQKATSIELVAFYG